MENSEIQKYINKQMSLGLKDEEILSILSYSERKRTEKNRKTTKRRNEIRRENGKKTKRGSKGSGMRHSPLHGTSYFLEDFVKLKEKIGDDLFKLTLTGNIIGLFKLYGVELKETYNLYRGLCPFHKENTPSFTIGKGKGVAKCFGCGKGYELMSMTFKLKFGEDTTKKRRRFEELEKDVDKFINLEPINKFEPIYTPIKEDEQEEFPTDINIDDLPF